MVVGRFLLLAPALLFLRAAATGEERLFRGGVSFPIDDSVTVVIAADLTGDGRPDLAAAGNRGVHVFLAEPDGILQPGRSYNAGLGPVDIQAGDLNADGALDLAVAASGESSVVILLNRGHGVFDIAESQAVGLHVRVIALGDFDGNRTADVAASDLGTGSIHLLAGDGRGGLEPAGSVTGDNPHALLAGDFDGDGDFDLAAANSHGLTFFPGHGDGAFGNGIDTRVGVALRTLASGQSGGGLQDIAAVGDDGWLYSLQNLGVGVFRPERIDEIGGNRGDQDAPMSSLQVVDFDGDGSQDIMATTGAVGESRLFAYRRAGGAFDKKESLYLGVLALDLAVADYNSDGILDAAVARDDASEVTFFRGTTPGSVATRGVIPLAAGPRALAALDVDGDGDDDVFAITSGTLAWLRARGEPGLELVEERTLDGTALQDIAVGDFGGGRAGLALADLARERILILALDGAGKVASRVEVPSPGLPAQLVAADFDGDGTADFAAGHQGTETLTVFFRPGVEVPPGPLAVPVGDGGLDLAAATREGVTLVFGDSSGNFPRAARLESLHGSSAIRIADLDGDGAADLVGASRSKVVAIHAAGGSEAPRITETDAGAEIRPLALADIDQDGRLDVAAGDFASLLVFRNAASGLDPPEAYAVGYSPRAILLGRFTGDGALDAVTADFGAQALSLLAGETRAAAGLFRRGDADGNGKLELTDAVVVLGSLFQGAGSLPCPDAADADDDGSLVLTDPIRVLTHLFQGGALLPSPGLEACGPDPSADGLWACAGECR
jgi:hypothetical protein